MEVRTLVLPLIWPVATTSVAASTQKFSDCAATEVAATGQKPGKYLTPG